MNVDVETEIEIARACADVAAFASDPDKACEWYANIRATEWRSEPPLALGSRIAFVANFLGRTLSYTYEVVEFDLPRRMVMRTADGPFPMETAYGWEPLSENRTRMTLRNSGAPSGFSKLTAPLMSAAMRRANRKDLAMLKQRMEPAAPQG